MDEHEVVWPMGMGDQDPPLADRPMVFNPKGFLVAILEDDDHAERADLEFELLAERVSVERGY